MRAETYEDIFYCSISAYVKFIKLFVNKLLLCVIT